MDLPGRSTSMRYLTRNDPHVRSYRDSQGFRIFETSRAAVEEKGRKLKVVPLDARIFHYSHVKNPVNQLKETCEFIARYESDECGEAMARSQ